MSYIIPTMYFMLDPEVPPLKWKNNLVPMFIYFLDSDEAGN